MKLSEFLEGCESTTPAVVVSAGGGVALAKKTVWYALGVPVHYYVRINFSGFERAVDEETAVQRRLGQGDAEA